MTELGIIPTVQPPLSGGTTTQPDVQSSTVLQPSTTMTYSSATGMGSTSQATGMGSTSQTNDDNKGDNKGTVKKKAYIICSGNAGSQNFTEAKAWSVALVLTLVPLQKIPMDFRM